jgi:hypothetical protein
MGRVACLARSSRLERHRTFSRMGGGNLTFLCNRAKLACSSRSRPTKTLHLALLLLLVVAAQARDGPMMGTRGIKRGLTTRTTSSKAKGKGGKGKGTTCTGKGKGGKGKGGKGKGGTVSCSSLTKHPTNFRRNLPRNLLRCRRLLWAARINRRRISRRQEGTFSFLMRKSSAFVQRRGTI